MGAVPPDQAYETSEPLTFQKMSIRYWGLLLSVGRRGPPAVHLLEESPGHLQSSVTITESAERHTCGRGLEVDPAQHTLPEGTASAARPDRKMWSLIEKEYYGAGERDWSVKCLLPEHKGLSLIPAPGGSLSRWLPLIILARAVRN